MNQKIPLPNVFLFFFKKIAKKETVRTSALERSNDTASLSSRKKPTKTVVMCCEE